MSHSKNKPTNPYSQHDHIPLIKPHQLNKLNHEQRLKEVYKSVSIKQKQTSKTKNAKRFYLPLPDKKQPPSHNQPQPKPSSRYQAYLQAQQTDKHYQQLSHRYQPKTTRLHNQQQNRKNDISSNLQIKHHFRRKTPNQFNNQSLTSRRQSNQILQQQLNQLNQNINKNKRTHNIIHLEDRKLLSRYNVSSQHQQTQYHQEMFKIRRSNKKSFSGSITKKPSEDNIRDKSRNGNHLHLTNIGKHSQLSSFPNPTLQEGKNQFKNGNISEALNLFLKGKQQDPKNLNFSYNIALVHLKTHNYEEGLKLLDQIIQSNPQFKKTVFLFAVISLRHLGQLQKAIQTATKGLQIFENFIDLIFYRGKLYHELGKTDEALKDMQKVLTLQKDHIEALYYSAFLYYQNQLTTHAMSALSAAIYYDQKKSSQLKVDALRLRAKLYLAEGKVKQAKRDLKKITEKQDISSQTYYLMGKVLIEQNNISDALINFQKCLRQKDRSPQSTMTTSIFPPSSTNQYLIPALLEICKTKIDMKDFYSAYHHINRYKHFEGRIDDKNDSLLRFRYFIEGVVFLMKRKIDEGMKNFEKFIQVQQKLKQKIVNKTQKQSPSKAGFNPSLVFETKQLQKQIQYFYPIFYLYRGYGYFMQNKHQLAINDYQKYEKSHTLDKYMTYNLYLAQGVSMITNQQFNKAIESFNKAQSIFAKTETKKIQPYIYRAIASIESARKLHLKTTRNKIQPSHNHQQGDNEIKVLQLVFQALRQLDKAYDLNDANSNLLFIRSLIYAYLNKHEQALDDIIKGIAKSEENVPKYFFFRGLIQSYIFIISRTMQNKKQAINDFNIAINLDNNYDKVFFERAKLNFQFQNYSKAFQDLTQYCQLKPQEDKEFHKTALYLVNGVYPMAEESSWLVKDQQSQKYKEMRFHIMLRLGKFQEAFDTIDPNKDSDKLILKIMQGDMFQIRQLFSNQKVATSSPQSLKYFSPIHYYHYLGVGYFTIGEYENALEQFTIALKQCNLRDMQKGSHSWSSRKRLTSQQSQLVENLGDKDLNCIIYNMFLCHLKLNDLRKAYELFIKEIMPIDDKLQKSQFMANFSHLLFQAMKRSTSQIKDPQSNKSILEDKQQAHVELFTNSFTDLYSKDVVIETSTFLLRTKLSYLNLQCEKLKREYSGKLWPSYVMQWLNVKQVQNRPQPPWVKRQSSDQGLVFTDQVQNINIEFQTTQHDEQQDEQQPENDDQEQQHQEQQYEQEQQKSQEDIKKRFDPRKFRDQMKLDDSIQRKLNKIVNKNNS